MRTLNDGSLLFEPNEPLPNLSRYQVSSDNPLRFVPKFEPCVQRRYEIYRTKCGRQTGRFCCQLDDETVSVESCQKCIKAGRTRDIVQHTVQQ